MYWNAKYYHFSSFFKNRDRARTVKHSVKYSPWKRKMKLVFSLKYEEASVFSHL